MFSSLFICLDATKSFFTLNRWLTWKYGQNYGHGPECKKPTSVWRAKYLKAVREGDREKDYFIGDVKHYLPLTCTKVGSKRKTALDGQWKQNAIESVFGYKHKSSFVSTFCLGRKLYVHEIIYPLQKGQRLKKKSMGVGWGKFYEHGVEGNLSLLLFQGDCTLYVQFQRV